MLTPSGRGRGVAAPARPEGGDDPLARLLAGRPISRMRPGLERVRAVLEEVGRPETAFRALHVGGTNGKGSASATAAALLRTAGHRVALYTSPHLVDVRERFRVDGAPVPEGLLQRAALRVGPIADDHGATYFESLTCIAFLAFAELGVEWAVVETGLGGRLDATNVVRSASCAITGVAVDHTDWLGGSLGRIAAEKAGILKAGVPAAVAPLRTVPAAALRARASELGAPLRWLDVDEATAGGPVSGSDSPAARLREVEFDLAGTRFTYDARARPAPLRLRTPLIGAHQAVNAAVALLALEDLPEPLPADVLERGLLAVQWPGRLQVREDAGGVWVLDAAHNPDALHALERTLRALPIAHPGAIVLSVLRDKPWTRMAALVAAGIGRRAAAILPAVAPSAPAERAWDPERAARLLEALGRGRSDAPRIRAFQPGVDPERSFRGAVAAARELAGDRTVLVTGSAHAVGDALRILGGAGADPRPEPGDAGAGEGGDRRDAADPRQVRRSGPQ